MTNQYKIFNVEDVDPTWFEAVVQQSLTKARKSLDKTQVILTIPKGIQGVNDVPDKWKAAYSAHEPYLTNPQAVAEMAKPEWTPPDEL